LSKLSGDVRYLCYTLIPSLFIIFGVLIYPTAYGFYLSLTHFDIHRPSAIGKFVGFENFKRLFNSYYFSFSWRQTLLFSLITIPLIVLGSFGVALMLAQKNFKLAKPLQVIVLIPWAVPYVLNASMWRWIFDPNYGLFNSVLYQLGLISSYRAWLAEPWSAFFIVVMAYVWTELPFCILLYFARLQSLPTDIYEQSLVDGAGVWYRFRYIIFTWMKPIFFVVAVWATLRAIAAFDLIYVLTGGGPAEFTALVSFFTYRETFINLNFGRGAALSVLITIIGFILVLIYFRLIKLVRLR